MKINREDPLLNHFLGCKVEITFKDGTKAVGVLSKNENKYYAAEYKLKYLDRLGGCQLIFYKSQVKKIELVS